MPRSIDARPVQITHHPNQRVDQGLSDLPKLEFNDLFNNIGRAFKVAFGVDVTSATGLAETIKQETGADLSMLARIIDTLFGGLYNGTQSALDPESAWRWVATTFLQPLGLFLDDDSPLDAANLFGRLLLPISGLTNQSYEALWNPSFRQSISMGGSATTGWSWDHTVYRPGRGGQSEQGSAKVVADGDKKVLVSNRFPLVPGENVTTKIDIAWHNLVYTSSPIMIELVMTGPDGLIQIESIGSAPPGAANPSGWEGLPVNAVGRHVETPNPFKVPADIDQGYLRLTVRNLAAAGTVWFDAASVMLTGNGIPTDWLTPLVAAMSKIQTPFTSLDNLFSPDAWDTAWRGFLDLLGLEYDENQIILARNSIWSRLFQSVIPTNTLNLHPDMGAVHSNLDIIFAPLGTTSLERAEAWDDMMALFNIESHAADTQAWWDDIFTNMFPSNSQALQIKSGAKAADDKAQIARDNIDILLGKLPGTTNVQKAQAWDDLMGLFGIQSHAADAQQWWDNIFANMFPSNSAALQLKSGATAAAWTAAGADWKADQAQGTADTVTDNSKLLIEDLAILFDWLHVFYPVGDVNDPPNATRPFGGTTKRTWYAAWNHMMILLGWAKTTPPPTDPAPKILERFQTTEINHQSLMDAVTTGATGTETVENTPGDTAKAVAALRSSVADLRAAVDNLQNEAIVPSGGVRFVASSNGWDSGGGGNWNITGTGSPAFTVNRAYYMVSQTGNRYLYACYVTPLSSNQHSVTLTFNAAPGNPNGFSDASLYGGSNLAILRATATLDRFACARIWKNRIQFGYYQGGTLNLVGTKYTLNGNIGPGVSVVVSCPNESNPYYFEARIAGQLVASHTFTAAQAPYGTNYRRIGQGMLIGVGILGDLFMPGQIQAVSAADLNVGPGFIKGGIGGVMRRYSDVAYNQQASFVSTVPENYFESLDSISPGITKLTGGGAAGFVVEHAGLYLAEAGFFIPTGANYYGATFYSGPFGVGGTIHSFNTYFTQFARGTAILVANDGDVIKPAASNGTNAIANMTGTADGRNAFFSIARVG